MFNFFSSFRFFGFYSTSLKYLNYTTFNYSRKFIHDSFKELVWTILPAVILCFLAVPSLYTLYQVDFFMRLQEPFVVIKVLGNQWFWTYEYFQVGFVDSFSLGDSLLEHSFLGGDGLVFDSYMVSESNLYLDQLRLLETDNSLIVPACVSLKFLVTSVDVLHCWAIPSLGIKVDACPGRINQIFSWVLRPGEFYGQCSEICGINHGFMPISLIALDFFNDRFSFIL